MPFYTSGMATKQHNIPVAMDSEFLAEIDSVAADVKDSRSGVMRRAIRAGLPLVKSGGEVVSLDGELSRDVEEVSKLTENSRPKVLLESIRAGLQAFLHKAMREKIVAAQNQKPENAAGLLAVMDASPWNSNPLWQESRAMLAERGAVKVQLLDLLAEVPEARERKEVIERHANLFRQRRGSWPSMWGSGVSTAELKRQIAELEREAASGGAPRPAAPPEGDVSGSAAAARATEKFPPRTEAAKPEPSPKGDAPDSANPRPAKSAAKPPKRKAGK